LASWRWLGSTPVSGSFCADRVWRRASSQRCDPPAAQNIAEHSPGRQTQVVSYHGSAAASGVEILIGIAAIVLGILSLIFVGSWVLSLVGFIAVGAALLMVSATFGGLTVGAGGSYALRLISDRLPDAAKISGQRSGQHHALQFGSWG
jgi:hypothetical protein